MRINYTISVVTSIMVGLMIMAVGLGSNATAAITSTSGTVVFESNPFPPAADEQVFVFDEQQGVPFVSTQPLDFGSILPGTLVNSHYIQYDPVSPTGFVGTGSVTFDGPIIGVITTSANLYADLSPEVSGTSDSYFGLESLLGPYPTGDIPSDRGIGSAEDDLIFAIGDYILVVESLEIPVPGNIDGIRVFTLAPIEIEVAIDIKPTSCPNPLNVKNKGVLPVAIVGTEEFDVTTVDPGTVMLEGVSPLRFSLEDTCTPSEDCTEEGPDGYLDLTLMFDIQEIVAALGEVNDGEELALLLIGNLKEEHSGTPIVGEDVVIIVKKGK